MIVNRWTLDYKHTMTSSPEQLSLPHTFYANHHTIIASIGLFNCNVVMLAWLVQFSATLPSKIPLKAKIRPAGADFGFNWGEIRRTLNQS